jgi:hypothetical protein
VTFDVSAICAKSIALLMDCKKTGKFPTDWNTEPSLEFHLGAAELIDRQSPDILSELDDRRSSPQRSSARKSPSATGCVPTPAKQRGTKNTPHQPKMRVELSS